MLTRTQIESLQRCIWDYYHQHRRSFAWRDEITPYRVFISEVMLQQTQTNRVITKFEEFVGAFPDFVSLADASLGDVLRVWQGLGYNRRGKFLHQAAQQVMKEHGGLLPADSALLVTLPGIGPATAASISAFAFNTPTVFIETNIRSVFIHSFFSKRLDVHDKELIPLIKATLDIGRPREWYYALMDYGVMLKLRHKNPSRRSRHHAVQSKFEGSDRQVRGIILRALSHHMLLSEVDLHHKTDKDERFERILEGLCREGMVMRKGEMYLLP